MANDESPMSLSNQYPRLPWEHHPADPVHQGFIAWPHGPDGGRARVYYDRRNVDGYWWVWTVGWTDRFAAHGHVCEATSVAAKQAAADNATLAYWDAMEKTEAWTRPVPPPEPVIDFVAWHFWRRLEDWLWNRATISEVQDQLHRYMEAVIKERPIIDAAVDHKLWVVLGGAYGNRLNFGFDPSRPAGKRGYFAERRAASQRKEPGIVRAKRGWSSS